MTGLIPTHVIEAVRDATDLASLVSQYIPLQKAGPDLVAKCPFHNEKTASFRVNRTGQHRNRYICFGCSAKGNCYDFLMSIEGWTFPQALEYLATLAGIQLTKQHTPRAVLLAQSEDAACSSWWWERRRNALLWSIYDGMEEHEFGWLKCLNSLLLTVDATPLRERLQIFRCEVTSADRREWREHVASEKAFADLWISIASDPSQQPEGMQKAA